MTCYCCYWTSTPSDGCVGPTYCSFYVGPACSAALSAFRAQCGSSVPAYQHTYIAPDYYC